MNNPESAPTKRTYASTEHNIDVNAAFTMMYQITHDAAWLSDAQHARQFVEAMWDPINDCYLAGTTDPGTRNRAPNQLPLDVQAWSILSFPGSLALHPDILSSAAQHNYTVADGFFGFDFNNDKDGVWFEGTGQMGVSYAFARQPVIAENIRRELRLAQYTTPFGDGFGIVAASHNGLTTGFGFSYFERLHIAATSWSEFAQLGFNPFYQVYTPRPDFNEDGRADFILQNGSTNQIALWYAESSTVIGGDYVSMAPPANWKVVGQGDFNGDGQPDLVLQNQLTNQVAVWYLNGVSVTGGDYISMDPPAGWSVAGVGDFNGDNQPDLVLQNQNTGQTAVWFLHGVTLAGGDYISLAAPAGWTVVGIGDINGDGQPDLALQNRGSGAVAFWYLNGLHVIGSSYLLQNPPADWSVIGIGDFDGDFQPDLILSNSYTGQAAIWYLNGPTVTNSSLVSLSPPGTWKIVGPR